MCARERGGSQRPTRQPSTGSESVLDRYPLVEGGFAGAGAFIVGYLLTYIVLFLDLREFSDGVDDLSWQGVGLIFYNAQFVRLDTGEAGTLNSLGQLGRLSETLPVLDDPSVFDTGVLSVPTLAYTLLVAAVLVGAGYLVTARATTQQSSVTERMDAGMTVAVGYLPLAVVGTFAFREEALVGGETISPDLFAGVLVAGVLFPLVFGAVGGYLTERL